MMRKIEQYSERFIGLAAVHVDDGRYAGATSVDLHTGEIGGWQRASPLPQDRHGPPWATDVRSMHAGTSIGRRKLRIAVAGAEFAVAGQPEGRRSFRDHPWRDAAEVDNPRTGVSRRRSSAASPGGLPFEEWEIG